MAAIFDDFKGPRTVEEIFNDFEGRRAGIVKALTDDVKKFYRQCHPSRKENLSLYGLPNKTWKVKMPEEEVPPDLPEPVTGINFVRDGMLKEDWLSLVAVNSDSWLLSVAFYYGGGFGKSDRGRLFEKINAYPTVYKAVRKQQQVATHNNGSNSKSQQPEPVPNDETPTLCGACDEKYEEEKEEGDFWIGCDTCQNWFHGNCVRITPAKAEHIKKYKCPSCKKNKRDQD